MEYATLGSGANSPRSILDPDDEDDDACCETGKSCFSTRRPYCNNSCFCPPRRSHDCAQTTSHVSTVAVCIVLALLLYVGYRMIFQDLEVHSRGDVWKSVAIFAATAVTFIIFVAVCMYSWFRSCACRQPPNAVFSEDEEEYQMGFDTFFRHRLEAGDTCPQVSCCRRRSVVVEVIPEEAEAERAERDANMAYDTFVFFKKYPRASICCD
jgi:hypothetical protein